MSMRYAYMLLGIATLIVFVGAFVVFQRAGAPAQLIVIHNDTSSMSLTLTSSAFNEGERIPSRFTCDGESVSPELRIRDVPEGAESLVLLMDDPDIPESVKRARGIEKFDHWVVYNIPSDTAVILEGGVPGTEGVSSLGEVGYVGPCPPDREHRYRFRLYALSGVLDFAKVPTLDEVESALTSMVLASTTLTGLYERVER